MTDMTVRPRRSKVFPWAVAITLSTAAAILAIEVERFVGESAFKDVIAIEVKRRAIAVTAQTLNGNVMGSVAALGLVDQPMKDVANGTKPLTDAEVLATLQAI